MRGNLPGQGLLGLLVLMSLGGPAAEASRIRHAACVEIEKPPAPIRLSFAAFLEAGPSLWSHATPRVPRGLALRRNPDGTAAPSLYLDYLIYRRNLDPSRFDAHHPCIAALVALASLPAITTSNLATPAVVPAPQTIAPGPLVSPQQQTVPEPSTLLFACLAVSGAAIVHRRGRRS